MATTQFTTVDGDVGNAVGYALSIPDKLVLAVFRMNLLVMHVGLVKSFTFVFVYRQSMFST